MDLVEKGDQMSSGSSNAATVEVGRRKSVQILMQQELVKDETLIYTVDISAGKLKVTIFSVYIYIYIYDHICSRSTLW